MATCRFKFINVQTSEKCRLPHWIRIMCAFMSVAQPHTARFTSEMPSLPWSLMGFVRLLRALYPKGTYVTNITDVDDKINAKAADEGVEIDVITKRYTKCYHEDLAALGCIAPDVELKATEHMPVMIAMISAIG